MAKKATLVCRPCGGAVTVSDLGAAVVECWECGVEMVEGEPPRKAPAKAAAKKAIPAKKAVVRKKTAPKKGAAKKPAPKRKK